jgi:hypothetical protein
LLKFFIVNFIPVMGAAVGQWVLGALWNSPVLFGRMAKSGAPEDAKAADKRWALSMLLTFAANITISVVLLHMILLNGIYGIKAGAKLGFVAGLGLVAAPMLATYIYEKRPLRLYVVNAGYWIVALTISSAFMARRIL